MLGTAWHAPEGGVVRREESVSGRLDFALILARVMAGFLSGVSAVREGGRLAGGQKAVSRAPRWLGLDADGWLGLVGFLFDMWLMLCCE